MSAKPETPAPPSAPGVHPKPFWSFRPRSDREAGDAVVSNFLLHWFPAKTYKPSLDWNYSFWLGTASAALFFLLVLSGLPLLLLYVPSVERAYGSVKDIEFVVTFGSWIRAVHRIAAHLMVAAVFLHLVRVFLTGAYKNGTGRGQRREWNWVLGVVMIVLTLFLSFTGYLLPWDQLAYWAVTVGTNIASSVPFVGPRDARAPHRRADDRPGDAHPLLRPPRHLPARRARRPPRVPHVAHPQGRRPREGRPLDADAGEDRGPAREDEDLLAPRRRARPGPGDPRRDARGRRPDGQLGQRPRPADLDRRPRDLRRREHPGLLHPVAPRGSRPTR